MSNVLPPQPPAWPSTPPATRRQPSRWLGLVSLGIALLAIGVALGAWLRPLPKNEPPPAPTYTSQQVADAKVKVCAAYAKVNRAVLANTGRTGNTDEATLLGLAANARIALFDSGEYLSRIVAEEPGISSDLAVAARTLAKAYEELALDYMAEADDSHIESSRNAVNAAGSKVEEICK
ncbi:hypothetical protein [Mycobacterium asiaticum]|uniref:hypothetical protein n=1 Tax=Mycobacterium asiaticum TaxID=1790 RepID=UPI0012DB5F07|nr:hypothetical protein [Mycobacterium asiaticum]